MARLEDLTVGTRVSGVVPGSVVTIKGDDHLLGLVSETHRIQLAWLFDPYVAIRISSVNPVANKFDREAAASAAVAPTAGRTKTHDSIPTDRYWSTETAAPRRSRRVVLPATSPRCSSTRHAQHLVTPPGSEIDMKLEIHIRVPGGIDDRRIRIVSENATVLKLVVSNFERE